MLRRVPCARDFLEPLVEFFWETESHSHTIMIPLWDSRFRSLEKRQVEVDEKWCPKVEKTVTAFTALKSLVSRGSCEAHDIEDFSLPTPRTDVRGPVVTPIGTAVTLVTPEIIAGMVSAYAPVRCLSAVARYRLTESGSSARSRRACLAKDSGAERLWACGDCRSLSDPQFSLIEGKLPRQTGRKGRPYSGARTMLEAIVYRYRTRIAWRDLPEVFGP